jgi:hypothetical protein
METGKVKVVLNALRDELQARRATGAQPVATAADDGAIRPASSSGFDADGRHSSGTERRKPMAAAADGVLVELSSDALGSATEPELPRPSAAPDEPESVGGPELTQRPIPEFVVPFFVPQEPFVVIAPYLVRAVLAAAIAGILMVLLL